MHFKNLYFRLNLLRHLSRKQVILIFSIFGLFAFLLPHYTHAIEPVTIGLGTLLLFGAVTGVVSAIVGAVAGKFFEVLSLAALVIGAATAILLFGFIYLRTGSAMLSFAIDRPFGVSLTNPANNPIINIGWTVLRDLTNMLFILGLAYIGLATALNISGFSTKKTFGKLLLFALLINFTPVICGVIVDAANIISNFFLSSVSFSKLSDVYEATYKVGKIGFFRVLWDTLWHEPTWTQFLMLTLYAAIAGTVLWLFAFLFLLRNFIIWLLVILSPLAFFAGIFDIGKQYYSKWWKHFISWSFIAVPAGFFLYLSHHLLYAVLKGALGSELATTGNMWQRFFMGFMPYFIVIVFLCIGFYLTLKVNAAGSNIVIGTAKKIMVKGVTLPKALGQKAGAIAGAAAGALAGGMVTGATMGGSAAAATAKAEGKGIFSRQISRVAGAAKGALTKKGREEGTMAYHRRLEEKRLVRPGYAEEMEAKRYNVGEQERRLKGVTKAEERRKIVERATRLGAKDTTIAAGIAMLKKLAEDKDFDEKKDLDLLLKLKAKGVNTVEADKAIKKALPRLAAVLDPDKAIGKEIEHIKKTQPGITTDAQAKEYMGNRITTYQEQETKKLIAEGLGEREARIQAKINLKLEVPQISQDIKIEMAQDQLDKMDVQEIRKNLQIKSLDTLMMLDTAHIEMLERASAKQRKSVDNVLRNNKEEIEDILKNERPGYKKLMGMMDAIHDSPAFVYGGAGRKRSRREEEEEEGEAEEGGEAEETSPTT